MNKARSGPAPVRKEKHNKRSRDISEVDITEYLAKRALKKAKKAAKKLKSVSDSGYSNDSNPFGDCNLDERFVWRKKIERDVGQGVSLDEFSLKAEKKRQRERTTEIEKVKRRREERVIEKAQHEEEMALLARESARAEFHDWEKKEEEFHFDQSKIRSEIRLREGRMKPIDMLSKILDPSDGIDIVINEPYSVFEGLSVKEMEELHEDIKMHLDLDRATLTHIQYWEALLMVCDWSLAEARKRDALDRARVRGESLPPELLVEDRGVHPSVEADVKNLLQGKTYGELEKIQTQIESEMRSGTAKVVEYWEAVLKRLHILKAKACLKVIHAQMLHKHLEHLQQPPNEKEFDLDVGERDGIHEEKGAQDFSPEPILDAISEVEEVVGSLSPQLLHGGDSEEAVDPEEDCAILERKRMAVLEERKNKEVAPPSIPEDKYHPRKPKYFNRVHTGYEWNKYNQTHYDHDNPPPKVVQGYKFNIFYPDLVDKSRAPSYTIERDGSSSETCIIRFHAGPPYEDIAFRIVKEEWEYSHKKGYKCTFERGILHLYFNFMRCRYRR